MTSMRPTASFCRTAGFTLVVLASIFMEGRGIGPDKRIRSRTEMLQLQAAIEAFKTYYKVDYVPSRIYLSETGNYPGIALESLAYLQRLWPKLGTNVDWNGNGKIEAPDVGGDMWLEGDQCLVFFLGGIPSLDPVTNVPVCTGFSTNPANPAIHSSAAGAGTPVRPPMFEFDPSRLILLPHAGFKPFATQMFSYLDTYGTSDGKGTATPGSMPYLYYSCYGSRNGYNRYIASGCSDCNPVVGTGMIQAVWPYAQGVGQYLNATGCQIISAGADQKFGSGTIDPLTTGGLFWTPATAASSLALDRYIQNQSELKGPGADDQSSFYDSFLGTPSRN